jgi:Protein of unknown function (DUF2778)
MIATERSLEGEHGGTSLDAIRMSISTSACYDFGAYNHRHSARRSGSHGFFTGAVVAGVVVGCAWTVYANIFAASVYPSLSSANFDAPVIKRSPALAAANSPLTAKPVQMALLGPAPVVAAPATVMASPLLSFEERFGAAAPQGRAPAPIEAAKPVEAPKQVAEAPKPREAAKPQVVASLPVARPADPKPADPKPEKSAGSSVRDMAQRAKAAVLAAVTPSDKPSIFEKLWGKAPPSKSFLSFASADVSSTSSLGPADGAGTVPLYDRSTAVYDISAHMVYLANGTKLEAHSGLGSRLDDPRFVRERMYGATPPHLYDLEPREALFHGVAALRLKPVGGEETIFGRSGLLAHTYMLGPNGDSNGCVSFRDYDAFLKAYRNGDIKRLAVVASID